MRSESKKQISELGYLGENLCKYILQSLICQTEISVLID